MKRLVCGLLALSMLLCLAGCGRKIDNSGYVATGDAILMEGQEPEDIMPEEEDTQELVLAYYPDRRLNPLFGSDYTNRVLMSLMYQGLFAVDSKKNVTPILCSGYRVSANHRSWTFYVDSNATFSDGTRVTAEDVVATYEQARQNDYYMNRFRKHLLSVSVTEDGGVLFQTDTSYQNLPLLLDVPIVKASEVQAELPLGTGPYTFTQGASGAKLLRNPNWWCGNLKIPATDDMIDLVEVSSSADVRDAFQFGDNPVSVVCTNPMSDSFAEYRCDYELWEIESGYMMYIGCNIGYSDFFDDGTLRTALTYAIDREYINDTFYNGLAQPSTLPSSPSSPYYNKSLADKYAYDDMKFVDAISGLDLPEDKNRQPKKMLILVNCDDSARLRTARYLAQHLTSLGVPTGTLEYGGSTSVTYEEVLRAGNFDLYLGQTKLPPTMELTAFFRGWGNLGFGGITDGTLYNMTKEALANSGNYYNLNQMVADDAKVIPVLFGANCVYSDRGQLLDLSPSRDNVFFYTLDKTMESARVTPSATGEG